MMKKFALAVVASILLVNLPAPVLASTGFFGNGFIVLSLNGGSSTFYDLNPQTQTLNPDFNGTFLGTFDPSLGDSLVIKGAEFNTFQDSGDNVSAVFLNYRDYSGAPPSFSSLSIDFVSQSGNNKFWQSTNKNVSLLNGLANGNYFFEVFGSGNTTAGDIFYSNNSANYTATFTVVPEPGTWAAGAMTLIGCFYLRRRCRA